MSLCKTVSTLAEELENQLINISDSHKAMLEVMKNMPKYLEAGDLAKWEEDYRAAISNEEDELSFNCQAIDLLYELAGANLFGAFQVDDTKRIYKLIVNELENKNIKVSENLSVEKW